MIQLKTNADTNLIANNSVELGSDNPNNWNRVGWGTNSPTYSYSSEGADGAKSIKVELSEYTNGDARWAFDSVVVTPNQEYSFGVYYKTNTNVNIIMDTLLNDGSHQYTWHSSVGATSVWKEFKFDFVAAPNSQMINIYMPISSIGYVQTDNYSLTPKPLAPVPSGDNLIANNSFEAGNDLGWNNVSWGSNRPTYTIQSNVAADGDYSAQLIMTEYTNGDARWAFANVEVEPNTEYQFSLFYKSNVPVSINMDTTKINGSHQYTWHGNLSSVSNWTKAEFNFVTAANDSRVNIYIPINSNGIVQTDNYYLKKVTTNPPQPSGDFDRALVSIDFDDGWTSAYTKGFSVLDEFGYKGTAGITTNYVRDQSIYNGTYMTPDMVLDLNNRGHSIASHTLDHANLTTLSAGEVDRQLRESKEYLENLLGESVNYFITPYCSINSSITNIAKTYYPTGIRNCDSYYNTASNFDQYNVKSFPIFKTTTNQEIADALDTAKNNKQWLVLMYHEVNNSGNQYAVTQSKLREQMQLIKDRNLNVVTSESAINEILRQL
ncbi:polysaccharide deacetylase family protein [Candidatus Gracilibacteria bacterium]|nr:polysaccharide deacetylase family protein [Candidatus Gracilibacteria bacterium]